jgi:hypothetical protein
LGSSDIDSINYEADKLPREKLINADPTGWWISEKFDGIRAYWNGRGRLFFANGKEMKVPEFFTTGLPYHSLDGELWEKRGGYENVVRIVKEENNSDAWKTLTYKIFDAPTQHHLRYEERIKFLKEIIPVSHPYAKVVDTWVCNGKDHLLKTLSEYEKEGAEGLIIRKPNSYYYEKGSFLKVESYFDADALVLSHNEGNLVCKLPSGKEFSIPIEKGLTMPEVGSVITFKYSGSVNESGLPQSPIFLRERPELRWEDVSKIKSLPYRLSYGKPAGPLPRCRGCKQQLRDRHQLRIMATMMFHPPGSGPYPGQSSFCLNPHCVNQANFDGRLGIDVPNIKEEDLPTIDGIEFVFNQ